MKLSQLLLWASVAMVVTMPSVQSASTTMAAKNKDKQMVDAAKHDRRTKANAIVEGEEVIKRGMATETTDSEQKKKLQRQVGMEKDLLFGSREIVPENVARVTENRQNENGDKKDAKENKIPPSRGLRGDGSADNPCANPDLNYCHKNAKCVPNATEVSYGYNCLCEESDGWTGDGMATCQDYDECANDYPCAPKDQGGYCVDHDADDMLLPKYACGCLEMYGPGLLVDDVHGPLECIPIDRCGLGLHDCDPVHGICNNEGDSTVCSCTENYQGDGKTCEKIEVEPTVGAPCDVCDLEREICGPNNYCICAEGFYSPSGVGGLCKDLPNCENGNNECHEHAICQELDGSHQCICATGYQSNGLECSDRNECLLAGFDPGCHENADCMNKIGTWACSCTQGYSGDGIDSCLDENECILETHNCHSDATCTNTIGSFNCTCDEPFIGDGQTCTAPIAASTNRPKPAPLPRSPSPTPAPTLAVASVLRGECAKKTDNCHPDAICTSTFPGFTCSCEPNWCGDGVSNCIPPLGVYLDGLSPVAFNPSGQELTFLVCGASFSKDLSAVEVSINGNTLSQSRLTSDDSPSRIIASNVYSLNSNGMNEIVLSGETDDGNPLMYNEKFWMGSNDFIVALVSEDTGNPYLDSTKVTVRLTDDPNVLASGTTNTGTITFKNLPGRTVTIDAQGPDNFLGTGGAVVQYWGFRTEIEMSGLGEPSLINNNDFTLGLAGWKVSGRGIATVLLHDDAAGPLDTSYFPDPVPEVDEDQIRRNLIFKNFELEEKKDLRIYTNGGTGPTKVSRTYNTVGMTAVQIRYRFETSEVPGGFFGSSFNDYYSISIRSEVEGGLVFDTDSMNGLGLEAFDYDSGQTEWRTLYLAVDPNGDVFRADAAVSNAGDCILDSSLWIDMIEEYRCFFDESKYADKGLDQALNVAKRLSRRTAVVLKLRGLSDFESKGIAHAYAHCFWNCRLAAVLGKGKAEDIATVNENCFAPVPEDERAINLANNAIGRKVAARLKEPNQWCQKLCQEAMDNGDLMIVNPTADDS